PAEPPPGPPTGAPTAAPVTAQESDPAPERDEHEQALSEQAETATVVPLFRRTSTWFAAAAAAVLLAVGGIAWSPWNGGEESISAIEQVSAAPDATTVKGEQGSLTAEVAYSRELGQSAISVNGLPPAPEGKAYQLWYFAADDSITSAGLLATGDDGTGEQLLEGDANAATGVGVTLEPAGGSDQPTTDPLVIISLA
ncbi:MAG: anti-sigma factor, partial [Ornithinibacter sp.]